MSDVAVRLTDEVAERLDAWRVDERRSRANAANALIDQRLRHLAAEEDYRRQRVAQAEGRADAG